MVRDMHAFRMLRVLDRQRLAELVREGADCRPRTTSQLLWRLPKMSHVASVVTVSVRDIVVLYLAD